MKSLTADNADFISFLTKLSPKNRVKLISTFSNSQIRVISEIFNNFLHKNLTTDTKVISKIKPFSKEVKKIALKRTPLYQKKKILSSKRGGAILSVLLPIAASLFSSIFR